MRRSKEDIIKDILEFCIEPALKTWIVYKSNLNFASLDPYLDRLLNDGLLETFKDTRTRYKTTTKGLEALELIKTLNALHQPVSQKP